MRLDSAIVDRGILKSRTLAQKYIESGGIAVNGEIIRKSSSDVNDSDVITLLEKLPRYVSRGGEKLEKALSEFHLNIDGAICCDIGASTGGFTDCLLQHGAAKVYAVDSGNGQLDISLLSDPRVISLENFNARNLTVSDIGELCDVVTVDVSFISQTYIIPSASSILKEHGVYIGLIKPQFECGREGLGKHGIVKDDLVRNDSVKKVLECAGSNNLSVKEWTVSPIKGGDGNTEFLFYGVKER